MIRVLPLALLWLLVGSGCVSYPPSTVVDGKYLNYRYQVGCETPTAWKQVKSVADRFRPTSKISQFTSPVQYQWQLGLFSDAVFETPDGTGTIALDLTRTRADLAKLPPQRIQALLDRELAANSRDMQNAFQISDYYYNVTPGFVSEQPKHLLSEEFRYAHDVSLRLESHIYAFTVNGDNSCFFRVTLFSEAPALPKNRSALQQLLKSIGRMVPPPDTAAAPVK